jgi:hypothetical protein
MRAVVDGVRRRLGPYALMVFVVWPLASLLMAALEIRELPYYAVSPGQALLGAAAGVAILARDFFVVGVLALAVCILCFATLAACGLVDDTNRRTLAAEPVVLFLAAFFGIALAYPTVVSHPVLSFAGTYPVLPVTAGLGLAAVAAAMARAGARRGGIVVVIVLLIGLAVPQAVLRGRQPAAVQPGRAPLVVLGLDSLSYDDDLSPLASLGERHAGTWYTHAVTPGLLTNAVWTSILLARPVREHGIFYTFQGFPDAPSTLITRARAAGFRTVSVFPDQITCAVGSQAGFDEDRSGPIGWRQLATQLVENASLLLPVVRPLLPPAMLGRIPANHAGTFTYDVDRELDAIFGEGDAGGRALIVSHLTYLHHPRFPSYAELTPEERRHIWWAPAGQVRDWSFNWQDRHASPSGFELRTWKAKRLMTAVGAAIERTHFLAPDRGGQLLVLADHGERVGLTPNTFWKAGYHHVPLLTIGLPARPDPAAPVSLLDVSNLIGLAPEDAPHDPAVEFIMAPPAQWPQLVRTLQLGWDGSVALDPSLMAQVFRGLRLHRPWPEQHPAQVYLVFATPRPSS